MAWLEDGSSWQPREEEELLLIDMSRHLVEDMLGIDNVELDKMGTVSMNLGLNLLGMFELGQGQASSCGGDWRLFLGTGGYSDSSSSTSDEDDGEGLEAIAVEMNTNNNNADTY